MQLGTILIPINQYMGYGTAQNVGATLGLIFKVLGEPIENLGPVDTRTTSPINGSAPAFIQLDTTLF